METINEMPTVMEQLIQNANDYEILMATTATSEQIEQVLKQNQLFERGLEICQNCDQESSLKLEKCESCGSDKLPF